MVVLSSALGMREGNSGVFWLRKINQDIYESTFGKALFYPEYSPKKQMLAEDIDYFGTIFRWSDLSAGDHFLLCLEQLYKKGAHNKEINEPFDTYVNNNLRYCTGVLFRHYKSEILNAFISNTLLFKTVKAVLDVLRGKHERTKIDTEETFEENLEVLSSYYKDKALGLFVGTNLKLYDTALRPVFESFNSKGIAILYVKEGLYDKLEKKDWGYQLNIRIPSS